MSLPRALEERLQEYDREYSEIMQELQNIEMGRYDDAYFLEKARKTRSQYQLASSSSSSLDQQQQQQQQQSSSSLSSTGRVVPSRSQQTSPAHIPQSMSNQQPLKSTASMASLIMREASPTADIEQASGADEPSAAAAKGKNKRGNKKQQQQRPPSQSDVTSSSQPAHLTKNKSNGPTVSVSTESNLSANASPFRPKRSGSASTNPSTQTATLGSASTTAATATATVTATTTTVVLPPPSASRALSPSPPTSLSRAGTGGGRWNRRSIVSAFPQLRTLDVRFLSEEFETSDLVEIFEPYEHYYLEDGGYRIKWLDNLRALVKFESEQVATKALQEVGTNPLVSVSWFVCENVDIDIFNKDKDTAQTNSGGNGNGSSGGGGEWGVTSAPARDYSEDNLMRKHFPRERTLEFSDLASDMDTADILEMIAEALPLSALQQQRNQLQANSRAATPVIGVVQSDKEVELGVRVEWMSGGRALAKFATPQIAKVAYVECRDHPLATVKPYVFRRGDLGKLSNQLAFNI